MFTSISIVLPAFNEEDNIEESVEQALDAASVLPFERTEVVAVDDGSVDRTGEILDNLLKKHQTLKVIHHDINKGYGAALRAGFAAASSDLIFYTDSDLQFDMRDIKKLLPVIEDSDIVAGYRINRQDSQSRLFFARGYNLLMRLLFGIGVRDVDCAFKIFRKHVFEKIKIESDDFFVDAEILVKARRLNLRTVEVGVNHYPRKAGHSTVRPSHIFTTLKEMAKIWIKIHINKKP